MVEYKQCGRVCYIVMLGPDECDEYTAHNHKENEDGSLAWMDSAGIPHIADKGTWRKEMY